MLKSNLENHYQELFKQLNNQPIEEEVIELLKEKNFYNKDNWLKGLILCELALDSNSVNEEIKKLYLSLYDDNSNQRFSTSLSDIDYRFWFEKVEEVNDKFLKQQFLRAYHKRGYIIHTARRPYRSIEKAKEYILQGIKLGDPACMATHGYNLYFAMRGEKEDKEQGLHLLHKSKELGYTNADNLLLNVTFYTEQDNAKILSDIEEFNNSREVESERAYHLLGEFYLYKEENLEKAKEILEEGIKNNCAISKYLLGINIINERIKGYQTSEGIEFLEKAYEDGVIYAANWLARYYNYSPDENKSIQKSIHWHEKANLYYFDDSTFQLALIYLYEDSVKDFEKGNFYLDLAIKEGNASAMSEKAYQLLNQEVPNIEEARNLLDKSIELGDSFAPYILGQMYENGVLEPDYYEAFKWYQLAAERNSIYGIELVGHYYRVGVTKTEEADPAKAIEYFNKAIEMGSNYAKMELAICYEEGIGVEKDIQKAYELYNSAAENGYSHAYNKIGYYEEDGLLGEKNYTKAFQAYQKSAESGNLEGIYNLGRAYKYGIGVPENPEFALDNFKKAAEHNYGDACIELALSYEGEYGGLEFDAEKIMDYMLKAAEQGYSFAQYKMGYYYYYGLVEKNFEKALEWLNKSYERGYPYAALLLGDYYLYNDAGLENPQDDKAFEYYKNAEEKGLVSEGLGVCYEYGVGTEENLKEAFKYYTLGAEAGFTSAKYRLGISYKFGIGTDENQVEAFTWLSKAAEEGNLYAEFYTAMMLLDGEGTNQDLEQGIIRLTKTAESEYAEAQFELGNCYLMGKGVAEDETKAMMWYQKASDNGHEKASKIVGKRKRRWKLF